MPISVKGINVWFGYLALRCGLQSRTLLVLSTYRDKHIRRQQQIVFIMPDFYQIHFVSAADCYVFHKLPEDKGVTNVMCSKESPPPNLPEIRAPIFNYGESTN